MMTDGMKKDFTEEVFKNFKEQMDKNFGAVSEKRLVVIEKGADADILRYSMKFAKQPEAMMSFLFAVKNEKPLLGDFGIALPQKEEIKKPLNKRRKKGLPNGSPFVFYSSPRSLSSAFNRCLVTFAHTAA